MTICYHIIANMQAGSGNGKKTALLTEEYFIKHNIPFEIYQTEYRNHAIELIKGVLEKFNMSDRLLVIGGDGTLHEVISGLKEIKSDIPIGYLPAGTGNDFARTIGLTSKLHHLLDEIVNAEVATSIECFVYHDKASDTHGVGLNSMGFGFDGTVIHLMDQETKPTSWLSKKMFSSWSYLAMVIDAFKNRKTFDVTVSVDGKEHQFSNVLIAGLMNHPYFGGGIKIDPEAKANNQELAIMIIQNISFFMLLRLLPQVLTTGKHVNSSVFHRFPGKELSIKLHQASVGQVDGEPLPEAVYDMDYRLSSFNIWK